MSEQIKDQAIEMMTDAMDELLLRIRAKFDAAAFPTVILRVDYVAKVAVIEFSDSQPTEDQCNATGVALRDEWAEMPSVTVTMFKLSTKKAKLIIDLNQPQQVGNLEGLVLDGIVAAPVIEQAIGTHQKTATVPFMDYDLTKQPIKRQDSQLKITPEAF